METRIEDRPTSPMLRFNDVKSGTWFAFADNVKCHNAGRWRLTNGRYATPAGIVHADSDNCEVVLLELAGTDGQTLLLRRVEE